MKYCLLTVALAAACLPIMAQDVGPLTWTGYFRGGAAQSSQGGAQVAFGIPGMGKYRLGNEADNYGEFTFESQVAKTEDSVFKAHVMFQFWESNQPNGNYTNNGSTLAQGNSNGGQVVNMSQYWAEGKGILGDSDAFKEADIWAGKRYYNRHNIDAIDTWIWRDEGQGGGVENINIGFAKLAYAYIQADNGTQASTVVGSANAVLNTSYNTIGYHAIRLDDIKTGANGALTLGMDIISAKAPTGYTNAGNTNSGTVLDIMHDQHQIFGVGDNNIIIQFGKGVGTGFGGSSANGNNNNPAAYNSTNKSSRVAEQFNINKVGNWTLGTVAVWSKATETATSSVNTTRTSFGIKPSYFFTNHFAVQGEVGTLSSKVDGQSSVTCTKETLALQWSPRSEFWSRPSFRIFYTTANWNAADQSYFAGDFAGKTNGYSYGLQTELWW